MTEKKIEPLEHLAKVRSLPFSQPVYRYLSVRGGMRHGPGHDGRWREYRDYKLIGSPRVREG